MLLVARWSGIVPRGILLLNFLDVAESGNVCLLRGGVGIDELRNVMFRLWCWLADAQLEQFSQCCLRFKLDGLVGFRHLLTPFQFPHIVDGQHRLLMYFRVLHGV